MSLGLPFNEIKSKKKNTDCLHKEKTFKLWVFVKLYKKTKKTNGSSNRGYTREFCPILHLAELPEKAFITSVCGCSPVNCVTLLWF